MLGVLAAAAVTSPALASASPPTGTSCDRAAWDAAFAKMRKHRAAFEAYQPTYDAAIEGFERDKPVGDDIDLRPIHPLITHGWRNEILHTADLEQMHTQFLAGQGRTWGSADPEKTIAIHRATLDQIREFRRQYQAAKDKHRYEAVVERGDALSNADYDAAWELFELPAPDMAALHWKIEHLFGKSEDFEVEPWSAKVMANFMTDAHRLLSGGLS
jgi:hypothetical protein